MVVGGRTPEGSFTDLPSQRQPSRETSAGTPQFSSYVEHPVHLIHFSGWQHRSCISM